MRKVILDKVPSAVTEIENVDTNKYYVGYKKSSADWGIITSEAYCRDYFLRIENGFTYGNGYAFSGHETLKSLVRELISEGGSVYEFDTLKEALEFLASKL